MGMMDWYIVENANTREDQMTKTKHTAETAEAEAVEQGLKAHYAMCKKIDELEEEIDQLKKDRAEIAIGVQRVHQLVMKAGEDLLEVHPIAAIGSLAARIAEKVNKEPF